MMKNAFYFTLKALFVLKIFNFLSLVFGYVGKRFDLKDKVNFKIYGVTTWLTINCYTLIAQYISRSKGNQAMKFGQLLENNMKNIFSDKIFHTQNVVEKQFPDSFLNNQYCAHLWIKSLKFVQFVFILC